MPYPIDDLTNLHLNAGTDDPGQARAELNALLLKVQAMIAATTESGASNALKLDGNGNIKEGVNPAGNINIITNKHLYLGTGNVFDIYHDGANGVIDNSFGVLRLNNLVNDGVLQFNTNNSLGTLYNGIIVGGSPNQVSLFYNDTLSMKSVSNGIETGQFSASGLTNGVIVRDIGIIISNTLATSKDIQAFYNSNGFVGSIRTSGSTTQFVTASDKQLKTSHGLLCNSGDILNLLEIHEFHFNLDKSKTFHGVMAQDAYKIYPNAISKPDNNKDSWGADYSKFVPLLIAHAQDLEKRILKLETT